MTKINIKQINRLIDKSHKIGKDSSVKHDCFYLYITNDVMSEFEQSYSIGFNIYDNKIVLLCEKYGIKGLHKIKSNTLSEKTILKIKRKIENKKVKLLKQEKLNNVKYNNNYLKELVK